LKAVVEARRFLLMDTLLRWPLYIGLCVALVIIVLYIVLACGVVGGGG